MSRDRLAELGAELQTAVDSLSELDRLYELLGQSRPDAVRGSGVSIESAVQIARMANSILTCERARLETLARYDLEHGKPGGNA